MTFDPTKPATTPLGYSVKILAHDVPGDYPIVALIEEIPGLWTASSHDKDGREYISDLAGRRLVNKEVDDV